MMLLLLLLIALSDLGIAIKKEVKIGWFIYRKLILKLRFRGGLISRCRKELVVRAL
jgi:hypothetical protein